MKLLFIYVMVGYVTTSEEGGGGEEGDDAKFSNTLGKQLANSH